MRWGWVWILLAAGCETVEGSGQEGSEVRDVETFESVRMVANVDATIFLSEDEYSAELVCDDNLLPFIEVEVFANELTVSVGGAANIEPEGHCEAIITAPELHSFSLFGEGSIVTSGIARNVEAINTSGNGSLEVVDIESSYIMVDVTGRGDVKLSGTADEVDYFVGGSGVVDAKDLVVEDVWLRTVGNGDVSITATETLEVTLQGTGNIDVYGNPGFIDERVTGSGEVHYH